MGYTHSVRKIKPKNTKLSNHFKALQITKYNIYFFFRREKKGRKTERNFTK